MEIRLRATEQECAEMLLILTEGFVIRQASTWRPDKRGRAISTLGRVYVDVTVRQAGGPGEQ